MATWASDGTPNGSFSNNAANGIQSIHDNLASNGDIITMPQGTRSWTVKLTITKAITLQGAGVNVCTVQDNVPSGSLLQCKMVGPNYRAGPSDFSKAPIRITGISFVAGISKADLSDNAQPNDPYNSAGIINFSGHDQRRDSMFRWDNCNITNLHGSIVLDTVTGLIDHCNFTRQVTAIFYPKNTWWQTQTASNTNYNSPTCKWADGSRADGVRWGSAEFVYIENCTLSVPTHGGITDMFGGARIIFRDNLIINGSITSHGTEGSGGSRTGGFRALEVYRNQFRNDDAQNSSTTVIFCRGGVHTIFDNTCIPGTQGKIYTFNRVGLKDYRAYNGNPLTWGSATGINDMDKNSGPYVKGLPDLTGTATTQNGAAAASHMTIASMSLNTIPLPWAANQLVGYTLLNRTATTNGRLPPASGTNQQNFGTIVSSTASTTGIGCLLTFVAPIQISVLLGVDFKAGDTFEINKIEHAIDSVGWGQGDILDSTHNPGFVPGSWPNNNQNQVNERTYIWGGTPSHQYGVDSTTEVLFKIGPGDAGHAADPGIHRPGYTALGVHPLAGGVVGPVITSLSTTFSTDAISQTFPIPTAGFTHPAGVTFTKTVTAPQGAPAGQMPAQGTAGEVTLSTAGVLSGTAVGAFVGNYILHLTAKNVSDNETALPDPTDFVLTISSPHAGPTITWGSPPDNQIVFLGNDVPLSANPLPGDSSIDKVEFYRGGTILIGTATNSPYTVVFTPPAAGTYSLTAKVYDTFNPVATATTSPAITLTVQTPISSIPGPTIVVTAGTNGGGGGPPISTTITFGHNKTNAISSTSGGANGGWQRELSDMWLDGGRVVRIDVDSANPPSGGLPGTTGYLNSLITYAKGLGFTQFVLIGYANITWTTIPNPTSFANYMVALAQAHTDCIIELSNEPNLHNISAANYASLATAAYSAMKSAGCPNTILLGSVGNSSSIVGGFTMMGWCQALFDNNCRLGTGFDWANYHNYGKAPPDANNLEDWWHIYTLATAGNLGAPGNVAGKSCQSIFGDPPFAMTEFGCPLTGAGGGSNDAGNNETTQATYISNWMSSFKAQSKCQLATQYALADEAPGSGTGYGLRRIDLTHRPAWDSFLTQATTP